MPIDESHLVISYKLPQRVYDMARGMHARLESEAPLVDEWCHGDVKGTVGLTRYGLSFVKHFGKHLAELHRPVVVDLRDDRLLVERRQRGVYLCQSLVDVLLQVCRRLVSDMVFRAKDKPRVVLVGSVALLCDDHHRAHDEYGEENDLQKVLFLHRLQDHSSTMMSKVPPMRVEACLPNPGTYQTLPRGPSSCERRR